MNLSRLPLGVNFWALATGAALITLHLTLAWRSQTADLWGTSALFWGAVSILVWEKREKISAQSSIVPSCLGICIVAFILYRSASIVGYDLFLRLLPVLAAIGLGLLVSGGKAFKQYWQEMLLLAFIAIPQGIVLKIVDLEIITAKFTGFILWYLGAPVSRQGLMLILPHGTVEVASGCNGVSSILQLLGLALLFLFMFPQTTWQQRIITPLVAVAVAFVVNALRVGLMAMLVANRAAFDYWHTGTGSLIFSVISVGIFSLFCWHTILRNYNSDRPLAKDTN